MNECKQEAIKNYNFSRWNRHSCLFMLKVRQAFLPVHAEGQTGISDLPPNIIVHYGRPFKRILLLFGRKEIQKK